MKKTFGILMIAVFLVVGVVLTQASAELIPPDENILQFRNWEMVFDENGDFVPAGSREVVVGDHFFGIIEVQSVQVESDPTHWDSGDNNQLTGLIIQRIENIFLPPDPYDVNNTTQHVVLGEPTITTFNYGPDGTSVDTTALGFQSGEILALWLQESPDPVTKIEQNGTFADDVGIAADGNLWATWSYDEGADGMYGPNAGADGIFGTADDFNDDSGYLYSHTALAGELINFTGEFWGQLDIVRNATGYDFAGIGDPNEFEMESVICGFPGCLLNDIYLSGELEPWPDSVRLGGGSPWDIQSNDPAHVIPVRVPEPGTMLLLGSGLLGLGAYYSRRKQR